MAVTCVEAPAAPMSAPVGRDDRWRRRCAV